MTCWQPLLRRAFLAALLFGGVTARPEAADAAIGGVGVVAGAGAHLANTGFAYTLNGALDVMGWGLAGTYWQQPSTSTTWLSAGVRKNVSMVPMLTVAPGVGFASLGSSGVASSGPMVSVAAGFYPLMMPFAIDASVGAAMLLNGSTALPYSVGAKVSLMPFTALVVRYRGWEGVPTFKTGGPEIGAEIGF